MGSSFRVCSYAGRFSYAGAFCGLGTISVCLGLYQRPNGCAVERRSAQDNGGG
jgi:hypothetical protein